MSPKNPKSLISHTVSGSSESQFYDVNHAREPRAVIVFPLSFLSFVPAHRARGGLGGGWQVGQGCPAAHHPPAPHHPLHISITNPSSSAQDRSSTHPAAGCCQLWFLPPSSAQELRTRGRAVAGASPSGVSVPCGRLLSPPGPALCGAGWLLPWLRSQPRLQQQGGRRAHMVLRVLAKTQLGSGSSSQICKELKAAPSGVFSSEAPQSVALSEDAACGRPRRAVPPGVCPHSHPWPQLRPCAGLAGRDVATTPGTLSSCKKNAAINHSCRSSFLLFFFNVPLFSLGTLLIASKKKKISNLQNVFSAPPDDFIARGIKKSCW